MGYSVFPAASGGVTQKVQEFTSTGTFTAPSNCYAVEVFLVAGGGGGGRAANTGTGAAGAGGGGAGGQVVSRMLSVTPGTAYTVTIGAAGSGATTHATGGTGGNTTFGSLATAYGGGGGGSFDIDSASRTVAARGGGGAGYDQGSNRTGGAAGGAGSNAMMARQETASNALMMGTAYGQLSVTTSIGGSGLGGFNGSTIAWAGRGIDGYGNGGAGGLLHPSSANSSEAFPIFYTGTGRAARWNSTDGRINAIAPTANTGDGGFGGVCTTTADTTQSGTNGASGYARVVYWS